MSIYWGIPVIFKIDLKNIECIPSGRTEDIKIHQILSDASGFKKTSETQSLSDYIFIVKNQTNMCEVYCSITKLHPKFCFSVE